jgi:hypothetical protein
MDASRRQGGLVSVGGPHPEIGRLVAVILVLVLAAILKPWGAEPNTDRDGTAVTRASSSPTPVATPVLPDPSLGPNQIACLHGLELVSLIHLGTWNVREWLPIDRTEVTDPDDPRLTFARIDGGSVRALGVCNEIGQQAGAGSRHPIIVSAWRLSSITSAPAHRVSLLELTPDDPATIRPLPHIYRLADGRAAGAWPPGRYALEVLVPDPGNTLWVGVEIRGASIGAKATPAPS